MIKANNARTMVMEYRAQQEAERREKVQKFLDTECESAITTAASNGKAECFVEVPTDMYGLVCSIKASLSTEGYFVQAHHNTNIAIQIRW
jgi:hypothetical protein